MRKVNVTQHQPFGSTPPASGPVYDCLVVGGGPGGLTAGIYLARFRRHCLIIDGGNGRASYIPSSHNYPGFPPGVAGVDLLERLRCQARGYGAEIEKGWVEKISLAEERFEVRTATATHRARSVILAAGIEDLLPQMPGVHDAIRAGVVRLCAVCDGYEVDGHSVAVYGEANVAVSHAVFLRTFSDRVTVVVHGDSSACEQARAKASSFGIELIGDRVESLQRVEGGVEVITCQGTRRQFELVYPSLGHQPRSALAAALGARCDEEGALLVDDRQRTTVPGLYAVGDVVTGLKQISVATGQAAVAATAVHNSLQPNPWVASL